MPDTPLTWGLLRALAACLDCPGAFRVPQATDWHTLVCPQCQGVWVHQPPPEEKRLRGDGEGPRRRAPPSL